MNTMTTNPDAGDTARELSGTKAAATGPRVYQLKTTTLPKKLERSLVSALKWAAKGAAAYRQKAKYEARLMEAGLEPGRLYGLSAPVVLVDDEGKRKTVGSVQVTDNVQEMLRNGSLFKNVNVPRLLIKTFAGDAAKLTEQREKKAAKAEAAKQQQDEEDELP